MQRPRFRNRPLAASEGLCLPHGGLVAIGQLPGSRAASRRPRLGVGQCLDTGVSSGSPGEVTTQLATVSWESTWSL